MRRWLTLTVLVIVVPPVTRAVAQTSSLGERAQQVQKDDPAGPNTSSQREAGKRYQGNKTLERASLFAIEVPPPKEFKVNDLITIVVRHQKKFEADAELEQKKDYEIKSELDAFLKFIDGGVGSAAFRRGKPNIEYGFDTSTKGEGDAKREDKFVTRLGGTIIDVKPNGNLVIQARSTLRHEEEAAIVMVTGECRSVDVTPDNTILSTQIAKLNITVDNQGAVKDSATRGWIPKLLDTLKPF